jgi:toxin ParE1/3/4
MRIRLTDSAMQDLQAINEWYKAEQAPAAGRALIKKIFLRIDKLSDYPELGRIVPEFGQQHIRELIQNPYRIVYRLGQQHIDIIRIWHSRRPLRLPG